MFEEELANYDLGNVVSSAKSCPDNECAIQELKNTDHTFIIYTRIIKLGEKLRFSGTILNSDGVVFTTKIIGLPEKESSAILQFLYDHVITAEYTCRFKWEPN